MKTKNPKKNKYLFPAIIAGASILSLGTLAIQRFIKKQEDLNKPNTKILEYKVENKIIEKICDDYLTENEKIELNYYKNLLPIEVVLELNDLILNSHVSFIDLNNYCNKKYKLGSVEQMNCMNYSKIKVSGCVRKKREALNKSK